MLPETTRTRSEVETKTLKTHEKSGNLSKTSSSPILILMSRRFFIKKNMGDAFIIVAGIHGFLFCAMIRSSDMLSLEV